MRIKNPPQDDRPYKEQIEDNYKKAKECLDKLRPKDINDTLGDFVGASLAISELRRIALGEPKIYASI